MRFLLLIILISFTSLLSAQDKVKDTTSRISPLVQYKLGSGTLDNPLKPSTTTSPRATLFSFIAYMNRSHQLLMKAHKANIGESVAIPQDSIFIYGKQAEVLFDRAMNCLDLSSLPIVIREDISYEKALLLKEIIDRVDIPHFTEIPDEIMIEREEELEKVLELNRWSLPETDIVIARIEEGPRKGEYLFNARTVNRLEKFYQRVQKLPYKTDEYTSDNFFNFYISHPGKLLPPKWINQLPDFLYNKTYFHQTPLQWTGMILYFLFASFVFWLLYRLILIKTRGRSFTELAWSRSLFYILTVFLIYTIKLVDESVLNFTGTALIILRDFFTVLYVASLAAASYYLITALGETLITSNKIKLQKIQIAYSRILTFLLSLMVAITVIVIGLTRLGVSLIPLVAGAGIGGLAIALGSQAMMENLFASLTIFSQKPYRMGNEIEILGYKGNVVEIGMAATKIQLLDGKIVTIPNKNIAKSEIENIGERPYTQRVFDIEISYSNQPDKINKATEVLKDILSVPENWDHNTMGTHPNEIINKKGFTPKVFLSDLIENIQHIKIYYWYQSSDKWKYREHVSWVNTQIIERFHEEEIEFASEVGSSIRGYYRSKFRKPD